MCECTVYTIKAHCILEYVVFDTTHCIVYGVHCTVFTLQCKRYIILSGKTEDLFINPMGVYEVHCCTVLYSIHCIVYSVYCIVYIVYCIVYNIHCTLYNLYFTVYSVYCTVAKLYFGFNFIRIRVAVVLIKSRLSGLVLHPWECESRVPPGSSSSLYVHGQEWNTPREDG